MPPTDLELIQAHVITETDTILKAMWVLKDQGQTVPLQPLIDTRIYLDSLLRDWADEHHIYVETAEDLDALVDEVRQMLTEHHPRLDALLVERKAL